jgi:hypothetical protein
MRRELVDQGVQAILLIHLGSIVLHRTIEHLYYNGNNRE